MTNRMDKDFMQHLDPKDDELARRLEAYAEARLSPEPSATIRMRARVMAAAHRQAALARADADRAAAAVAIAAQAKGGRTRRSAWRRPMTALLAAGLTLAVGVGSVAAAQAGGPLYGVRVWTETLTLPSEADARAHAELQRLQDRLSEAAAATATGDTNAANAALEAYGAIVNEATEDAGNDVSAAATLEAGVRSNIDVLEVLVDRVPTDAARDAIQRAIDRSDSAIDRIHGNPNATPPGLDPAGNPKPDKTANPNKPTADPAAATAKPRPTPKADPTTNAASTAKPDRTPRGGPPSEPPGGGGGGAPQSSNEGN
ncbi:MAG: DUF5667 domain-containing protein [Chloroflexota bacterium]